MFLNIDRDAAMKMKVRLDHRGFDPDAFICAFEPCAENNITRRLNLLLMQYLEQKSSTPCQGWESLLAQNVGIKTKGKAHLNGRINH